MPPSFLLWRIGHGSNIRKLVLFVSIFFRFGCSARLYGERHGELGHNYIPSWVSCVWRRFYHGFYQTEDDEHNLSRTCTYGVCNWFCCPLQKFHMNSHVKSCGIPNSHEITCDISHVKGFHIKSHVTFHMWKDFTWNHMWKEFTWNHMWHFTCERISHELKSEISHVKIFHIKFQVEFHMLKVLLIITPGNGCSKVD